jgi:predicted nucleotidyltransferase
MQTNLEQVTNLIRGLPLEDLEKVREIIDETERQKRSINKEKEARLKHDLEQYKKARKWINENGEKYMNKWVCLEGDELIAVDDDGRTVYQKAREKGIKAPFIHHIVDESLPFGGW